MFPNRTRSACRIFACLFFVVYAPLQTIFSSEIDLSWRDNSENEDGFCIERSVNGQAFVEIKRLAADQTQFVDTDVVDGNAYRYRIRAFNEHGYSGYTNVAESILEIAKPIVEALANMPIGIVSLERDYFIDAATGVHHLASASSGFGKSQDNVHFCPTFTTRDSQVVTKVHLIDGETGNAETGLMFRQSFIRNSAFAAICIDKNGNVKAQWRKSRSGTLSKTSRNLGKSYNILRLRFQAGSVEFSASKNGYNWIVLEKANVDLGYAYMAGPVLSSGNANLDASAAVEIVESTIEHLSPSLSRLSTAPSIESIGLASNQIEHQFDQESNLNIQSTLGTGFNPKSDQLNFKHWTLSGDFRFVAKIHALAADGDASAAGVMLRSALSSNAVTAASVLAGNDIPQALWRSIAGKNSAVAFADQSSETACLAIERVGKNVSMLWSKDGVAWETLKSVSLPIGSQCFVGLVIGSENGFSESAIEITGAY